MALNINSFRTTVHLAIICFLIRKINVCSSSSLIPPLLPPVNIKAFPHIVETLRYLKLFKVKIFDYHHFLGVVIILFFYSLTIARFFMTNSSVTTAYTATMMSSTVMTTATTSTTTTETIIETHIYHS